MTALSAADARIVAALDQAEKAMNAALRDATAAGISTSVQVGDQVPINGTAETWVKVSAWRRTDLR